MLKPIVTLLALALTACATQLGVRDNADLRLQMFSQLVFAPDYDSQRLDFLAKWTSPPLITIKGELGETYRHTITAQAGSLAALTGLDIAVVGESEPANVTIYFAETQAMDALAGSRIRNPELMQANLLATGCHFLIDKDTSHRITGAAVFIRTGPDVTTVKYCVSRVVTRILGFLNNSELIQPSIFNANYQLKHLTALDLKLIRALYSPTLKPGMPRREALRAADELL